MSYLQKYLKYKNKYLSIKNNSQGGATDITKIRILCVIDVQDCFLHGTMESTSGEKINDYKKKLFDFIKEQKNNYDVIVFTKDNHPEHHKSFGLYNPHCVNLNTTYCGKEARQSNIEALYQNSYLKTEKDVYKIHLENDKKDTPGKTLGSYKSSSEGSEISSFEDDYRYVTKLQLKQAYLEETCNKTNITDLDLSNQIDESKGSDYYSRFFDAKGKLHNPYIIRVNKGELCNFDAYGAFAYHVSYEESQEDKKVLKEVDIVHNPKINTTIDWSKLSTGLGEFLINPDNYINKENFNYLEIDVCGLVTNICVASTCITGCKIFENLKKLGKSNKLYDYKFTIKNDLCLNLLDYKITKRNAQKMISDNELEAKITITNDMDINNFNPKIEYNNIEK